MKFQDIPVNIITVRIKRSDNVEALQEQPVFSVEASLSRADEFEMGLQDFPALQRRNLGRNHLQRMGNIILGLKTESVRGIYFQSRKIHKTESCKHRTFNQGEGKTVK